MTVRSPSLLALSLALLAASGGLALLLHDGEVGTDESMALIAEPGSPLRLKGTLAAVGDAPDEVRDRLANHTVVLEHDSLDLQVLVTADAPLPEGGTWVVEGLLVYRSLAADGGLLVLKAHEVTEPLVFG